MWNQTLYSIFCLYSMHRLIDSYRFRSQSFKVANSKFSKWFRNVNTCSCFGWNAGWVDKCVARCRNVSNERLDKKRSKMWNSERSFGRGNDENGKRNKKYNEMKFACWECCSAWTECEMRWRFENEKDSVLINQLDDQRGDVFRSNRFAIMRSNVSSRGRPQASERTYERRHEESGKWLEMWNKKVTKCNNANWLAFKWVIHYWNPIWAMEKKQKQKKNSNKLKMKCEKNARNDLKWNRKWAEIRCTMTKSEYF